MKVRQLVSEMMSPSENLLVVNNGPAGLSTSALRHCATSSLTYVSFFIVLSSRGFFLRLSSLFFCGFLAHLRGPFSRHEIAENWQIVLFCP